MDERVRTARIRKEEMGHREETKVGKEEWEAKTGGREGEDSRSQKGGNGAEGRDEGVRVCEAIGPFIICRVPCQHPLNNSVAGASVQRRGVPHSA